MCNWLLRFSLLVFAILTICCAASISYAQPSQPPQDLTIGNESFFNCISSLSVNEDSGTQIINLSNIHSPTLNPQLYVTVSSANGSIFVRNIAVQYINPNSIGAISFEPTPNASGIETLTILLRDSNNPTFSYRRTVTVTINSVYDAPTVTILSPANNTTFDAPASVLVIADVVVDRIHGSSIAGSVQLLEGNTIVASDAEADISGRQFMMSYADPSVGTHVLTVRVTDNTGRITVSSPLSVVVREVVQIPTPILSLPSGTNYTSPMIVPLRVTAPAVNGNVPTVTLLDRGAPASPAVSFIVLSNGIHSQTWSNVAVGTHVLRARATYPGGNAVLSNEITMTMAPTPAIPSSPVNLSGVVLSRNAVRLTWTGTLNGSADVVDWYSLYRSTTAGTWPATAQTSSPELSLQVGNLTPATTYYFKLTAVNRGGESAGTFVTLTTLP